MKISKINFLSSCLSLLCLFAVTSCNSSSQKQVVICSKDFSEQVILAEILAQHIEAKTDIKVERELNLGGSLCHQSLTAGKIDLYVEYTGTGFTNILKQKPISDPKKVLAYLKQEYPKQFKAEWTEPLGFNNGFAIIVRGDDAKKLNLQNLSQLGKAAPKLRAGFGPEFKDREDGFPGLAKTYGIKFAEEPKELLLGLLYQALQQKEVDVIAGGTTDGLIQSLGLVVLKDDKNYFPPYEAVPVVRSQILEKYPELRPVLAELGGKISEEDMRQLNYQVDGKQQDAAQLARQFLQQKLGESKPATPAK
ncbi:MAG: ABC transporter substrate-binding protein [Microcoleus sp. PH2017_29_MFU_D_A]|jgi:osmoprotectant transport system substrate-binding protein|uniref:glycine betaine ABC transporter substrate-binding protein n=1 Tax=unclassified Microcoleus TaxID=2642155 RepID=UPI001DE597F0|nr:MULTISPECIES: glycine betaine ABC transporter substrate-binding protein [unclassified Microcoleus]MCC3421629.1 ABC transporter substrate-binding protein [Microcoleus sp. PH2017_07_MST_O_A]MCC3434230.1 ABC transporter substrate-binding protein [Microcoleus sp. PH2017_05_CCC_O_A]MCC3510803.1 ABC transporter substrate-binding protein [Microcoleus sp. PH2017_17_BER_D_A]MCC3603539.1 ABC transporter substrate-binding protein [Microcoleus sp. PH2017_29_MFU_D_A]TAG04341.1 MAG: ABC transporter subst